MRIMARPKHLPNKKGRMTMFRKTGIAALAALSLSAGGAFAAGAQGHVEDVAFSFEGPFGKFDQNQLQRGLKVYTQVCSACHGLQYVPLRTLADEGGPHLPGDQMRAYAQQFEVYDAEIDDYRPAKPVDHFPGSQLANAPDLSLMAKKRAGFHGPYGTGLAQLFNGMGGPEYSYSLMTGYHEPPECARGLPRQLQRCLHRRRLSRGMQGRARPAHRARKLDRHGTAALGGGCRV
jgi:ubiquinol-cytochrome c reductase cytochrome c1 subunit